MELPDLDLTEYQVFQKLNSLRTDKAQGPDNVSRIAEQIAKPVLQCIEFKKKISWRRYITVGVWKSATVSPITKAVVKTIQLIIVQSVSPAMQGPGMSVT